MKKPLIKLCREVKSQLENLQVNKEEEICDELVIKEASEQFGTYHYRVVCDWAYTQHTSISLACLLVRWKENIPLSKNQAKVADQEHEDGHKKALKFLDG